jgi:hypothetical protein
MRQALFGWAAAAWQRLDGTRIAERAGGARAEREVILHVLDPERPRDWAPGELGRVIADQDARLDTEQVEATLARLTALGIAHHENAVWRASPGLRRLDQLGLIGV